jgi:hypothetical protein
MALSLAQARQFSRLVMRGDFRAASKIFDALLAGDFLSETAGPVLVPDAATYTVLAADSGKRHILPDFTATCTFTLPAGATGLRWLFQSNAIAADAQNWVFTAPAGVFYRGGIGWNDTDAGPAAAETKVVFPNGSSHITLTVVAPTGGTTLEIFWDGTRYVVGGFINSITTPAFT